MKNTKLALMRCHGEFACRGFIMFGVWHRDDNTYWFTHVQRFNLNRLTRYNLQQLLGGTPKVTHVEQWFSTFVRPRPGKFFFYKTRARSQQIYS